jgi:uncharacterized protein (TIGR02147 family)
LRQRAAEIRHCSQSLISQILSGRRRLTRNNLCDLAQFFNLTPKEFEVIDKFLQGPRKEVAATPIQKKTTVNPRSGKLSTNNSIVEKWYLPYVKDLVHLHDFRFDQNYIYRKLDGMLTYNQIEFAMGFLLEHGFWRRTVSGRVVANEKVVATTHDIPDRKIAKFHAKSLELAAAKIEQTTVGQQRKSSCHLMQLNQDDQVKLFQIFDRFHADLQTFLVQQRSSASSKVENEHSELFQFTMHITPITTHLKSHQGLKNET